MIPPKVLDLTKVSNRIINLKRSPFEFLTCKKSEREGRETEGWEYLPSRFKKSIRMRKRKPHHIAFEERVWALFAKMQFSYINENNTFKLKYSNGLEKQIDVMAVDDEAIMVIECKSTETRGKASYQKDINELIGLKENLRISAQNLFPGKQKIAFIFATNNAVISDNDRKRLEAGNIYHFTNDDIEYFEQLTDLLGFAAKYQLFGNLFAGQKIPELKNKVPAVKGKVSGGHIFYSFSIDPYYLLKIGFVLHRTEINDKSVLAYQRLIKKARLKKIGKYIDDSGYFPNSVIINIETSVMSTINSRIKS